MVVLVVVVVVVVIVVVNWVDLSRHVPCLSGSHCCQK